MPPYSMTLNWDDVTTTTIELRRKKLANNVLNNNALLYMLREKGKVDEAPGGRSLIEELNFTANTNAQYYSGAEPLDIAAQQTFTAAEFAWKQAACAVSQTGLEDLQNEGAPAMIELITARVSNAEDSLENLLATGVYSAGTASSGKQVGGLQYLVQDAGTGTVGGIDSSTYTWWQNQYYRGVTDGGTAVSAANIKRYLHFLKLKCTRNNDAPSFGVADNNYYVFLNEALAPLQVIQTSKLAEAGFEAIKFQGIEITCDGALGGSCPANHLYLINPKYLKFRPHSRRNMVALGGTRQPINQDVTIKIIAWAGNLTCSGRKFQGVLVA